MHPPPKAAAQDADSYFYFAKAIEVLLHVAVVVAAVALIEWGVAEGAAGLVTRISHAIHLATN
jgi:hypothetical protein